MEYRLFEGDDSEHIHIGENILNICKTEQCFKEYRYYH